jgi:hypothetical protein
MRRLKVYPDSEILFPNRCIRQLIGLRSAEWDELVQWIVTLPEPSEDSLAFSLMMIKLGSCLTCDLDSYRASLGCITCARRTVTGFKGTDAVLRKRFEEARSEVHDYLETYGHNGACRRPIRLRRSAKKE